MRDDDDSDGLQPAPPSAGVGTTQIDEQVVGEDFAIREGEFDLTATQSDTSLARRDDEAAVLICIGSPENEFANAGIAIPLDDIGRVRFGRVTPEQGLEVEATDKLLHVGIPLPWVSSVHAELSILRTSDAGFRFHLTDLGSRNGTVVEGQSIDRARLALGEIFEVGRSFWTVRVLRGRENKCYGDQLRSIDVTTTLNPRLKLVHADLNRLAQTDVSVLIHGETGTGKEHLALAMHEASGRPGPFVRVNVAALPLLRMISARGSAGEESDLLQRARGGTIFIDEVGELSDDAQARLLHLARRAGPPANGDPGPRVDVRIIAATTRNLDVMAASGAFREDLFACLSAYEARLPPLRDRREDLGKLIQELCSTRPKMRVTTRGFRRALGHRWPFNMRELSHALRAAAAVSDPDDTVTGRGLEKVIAYAKEVPESHSAIQKLREDLLQLLIRHAGNLNAVARELDRELVDVEAWMRRFELRAEDYAELA
jgi:hypothetical protein